MNALQDFQHLTLRNVAFSFDHCLKRLQKNTTKKVGRFKSWLGITAKIAASEAHGKLSPKKVIELSECIALNELKDTVLLMKTHYDWTTVIQFIESRARAGGYPYRCHVKDDDGHSKTT